VLKPNTMGSRVSRQNTAYPLAAPFDPKTLPQSMQRHVRVVEEGTRQHAHKMIESVSFVRKMSIAFMAFAVGIYAYTLYAMKQEHFLDDSVQMSAPIRKTAKQTPAPS